MTGCCVAQCRNRSEKGYRMFRLPSGKLDSKRREMWIQCIGRNDLNPKSMICEVHFSEKQFELKRLDNRQLLRSDAIPDLLIKTEHPANPAKLQSYESNQAEIMKISCFDETLRKKRKVDNKLIDDCSSNNIIQNDLFHDGNELLDDDNNLGPLDPEMNTLFSDSEFHETYTVLIEKLRHALRKSIRKCSVYKRRCEEHDKRFKKVFNEDQLQFLETGSHRGTKWSEETLSKSVKLYLACGEKGYEELRNQHLPYPSIRTIQHRIRNLKLKPGILEDIFSLMHLKITTFKPEEKHAALVIDEMAIRSGLQYDNSLCTIVGRPTMNNSLGIAGDLATHALVFMLVGISSMWKQTVAYEFTGNSFCSKELLARITQIIKKAYEKLPKFPNNIFNSIL